MGSEPLIFVHLKLVAKISLAIGAVAVLSLLGALTILGQGEAESYAAIIRSNALTAEHLGTIMLLAGLVLMAIAGVLTWLIALYSSFRIAGPLYRFSQNLRLASSNDSAPLVRLRRGDPLRRQADGIENSVAKLRSHYTAVEELASRANAALERGDAVAYADAAAQLKVLDAAVRL